MGRAPLGPTPRDRWRVHEQVIQPILITSIACVFGAFVIRWAIARGLAVLCGTTLVFLEAGVRTVLEQTSLYIDATYSQPALRVQGVLLGLAIGGFLIVALIASRKRERKLEVGLLDFLVGGVLLLALIGAVVGLVLGHKPVFIVGDTYKLLVIPATYFAVRLLAKTQADYEQLFLGVAGVGLGTTLLLMVEIAMRVTSGGQLNGVGAPPLFVLAGALAVVVVLPLRDPRRLYVSLVVIWVLGLNLLSMSRGVWLVSLAMLLAATMVAPIRVTRGALLPAAIVGAVVVALATAFPTALSTEFEGRVRDLTGSRTQVVTLLPPGYPITSVDERIWEVKDSMSAVAQAGPAGVMLGRGAGAEYETALGAIEGTSSPGQRHQIHVTWVSVLHRHGALGLALLVGILGTSVLWLVRDARRSESPVSRLTMPSLTLLLWVIGSVIILTDAYGFFGEVSWGVALAMTAGYHERAKAQRASAWCT
jgi:hypothetical protein